MARRKRQLIEEEDATHQGGWLFADSFLALMVVFLATISFVPALGGGFQYQYWKSRGHKYRQRSNHGL